MNKHKEIQAYSIANFFSLAVNALISGIYGCSLFVLVQVEFHLTFEWKASDVSWNMLICALKKRRGKKKKEISTFGHDLLFNLVLVSVKFQ